MINPLICALLTTLLIGCALAQKEDTTVTFFVEHTVEPQQDYLAIVVSIKEQQASLKEALVNAEEIVATVRQLIQEHCRTHSKKKGECQEITQSGKFNVEPYYRTIRQAPVFIAFEVTYEVTGKIIHTNNVGQLVDKINKLTGTNIPSLEWQAYEEGQHDVETVGEGLEEAQERCGALGMNVGQIQAIEEVANFELEEQEGAEEEEEEEEQEEEIITYKFVVRCVGKKAAKKSKQSEGKSKPAPAKPTAKDKAKGKQSVKKGKQGKSK